MLELREYTIPEQKHIDWLNDKDLMRYSDQRHVHHTRASVQHYMFQVWFRGVYLNDVLIGTVAASIDKHNDVADLGILMGGRRGYGKAAWKLALDELSTHRMIVAGCMVGNQAMQTIMRRTMEYSHIIPDRFLYDGKPMAGIYYRRAGEAALRLREEMAGIYYRRL